MSPTASSSRSRRSPKPLPKSIPNASCSRSNQPPPSPSTDRPPLIVVDRGRELGGQARVAERVGGDEQAEPGARTSTAATAASVVQPSSFASSGSPSSESRWSSTQRLVGAAALGGDDGVAKARPVRPLDPERGAEADRVGVGWLHRSDATLGRWSSARRSRPPSQPRCPTASATRSSPGTTLAAGACRSAARPTRTPCSCRRSMAQQTQISRVAAAWARFMAAFPTVADLAAASPADVLRAWRGMGYNRRALNLWRAARVVVEEHGGRRARRTSRRSSGCRASGRTRRGRLRRSRSGRRSARSTRMSGGCSGERSAARSTRSRASELQRRRRRGGPGGPAGRLDARADGRRGDVLPDDAAALCRAVRRSPGAATRRAASEPAPDRAEVRRTARRRRGAPRSPTTRRWLRGRILDRLREVEGAGWVAFGDADRRSRSGDGGRSALGRLARRGPPRARPGRSPLTGPPAGRLSSARRPVQRLRLPAMASRALDIPIA